MVELLSSAEPPGLEITDQNDSPRKCTPRDLQGLSAQPFAYSLA